MYIIILVLLSWIQFSTQYLSFSYILKDKPLCFQESLSRDVVIAMQVIANNTEFTFKAERKMTKAYELLNNSTNTVLVRFTYTTVDKNADLRYCFLPKGKLPIKLDVTYKTGSETNDYKAIATRDNLNKIQIEVQKLVDIENDIKREKVFLIDREAQREKLHHGISRHIISYGLMCLGIFFILSYFTMRQIRIIIIQKKII